MGVDRSRPYLHLFRNVLLVLLLCDVVPFLNGVCCREGSLNLCSIHLCSSLPWTTLVVGRSCFLCCVLDFCHVTSSEVFLSRRRFQCYRARCLTSFYSHWSPSVFSEGPILQFLRFPVRSPHLSDEVTQHCVSSRAITKVFCTKSFLVPDVPIARTPHVFERHLSCHEQSVSSSPSSFFLHSSIVRGGGPWCVPMCMIDATVPFCLTDSLLHRFDGGRWFDYSSCSTCYLGNCIFLSFLRGPCFGLCSRILPSHRIAKELSMVSHVCFL